MRWPTLTSASRTLEAEQDASAGNVAQPHSSLALPVDCFSRDSFHRHAKVVARELGADHAWRSGKCWLVTRDAWMRYRAKGIRREREPIADDETLLARSGLAVVR